MTNTATESRSTDHTLLTRRGAIYGLMGAVSAAVSLSCWKKPRQTIVTKTNNDESTTSAQTPPQANIDICLKAVDRFHLRDVGALNACVVPLDEFFDRIRLNVGSLVDDLFSLSSSFWTVWYFGKDKIWGGTRAQDYIAGRIAAHLELPDGLSTALQQSRERLQLQLIANEQRLYLELEPELQLLLPNISMAACQQMARRELTKLQHGTLDSAQLGAIHNATTIGLDILLGYLFGKMLERAVQTAVARVVTALAVRGGVATAEATVLGAGAASGTVTAGITFFVSVLIACLIDWIAGKITKRSAVQNLAAAMEDLHAEVRSSLVSNARAVVDDLHSSRKKMLATVFA